MHDRLFKTIITEDLDHFILHLGPKNVTTERSPQFTTKSIVDLTKTLENASLDLILSKINVRTKNTQLNEINIFKKHVTKGTESP